MQQYLDLLKKIKEEGIDSEDRTGVGTRSIFGHQMRFDLQKGFPLVTTKKVYWKGVVYELLWFLKGDTNIKYLTDHNVNIWNDWADENGDLGAIYGHCWRNFAGKPPNIPSYLKDKVTENSWVDKGVDQIANVIESIKNNPLSRRHIICTWNPLQLDIMALPPCHAFIQFYVRNGKLSCQLYQRSCDAFLGLPFNIASYSLLTHMIAKMCDLEVGEFVWTGGDVHIYHNHFDQVDLQLTREPLPLPTLNVKVKRDKIEDYDFDDFELINYQSYDKIPAPIAV